jgi:hypothetical protein
MRKILFATFLTAALLAPFPGTAQIPEAHFFYLPVLLSPRPAEVVVTAKGEDIGYPTYYYVYGEVRNLMQAPLYSVSVGIEVTIYPYEPLGNSPALPYTEIVQVTPALTATLPGQSNPFAYGLLLGKASATIGEAHLGSWKFNSENGEGYAPLTVIDWFYQGGSVSGMVRNDASLALHNNRVVVASPDKCAWQEANLDSATLQPGEETSFHLSPYSAACASGDLVIVGQGAY